MWEMCVNVKSEALLNVVLPTLIGIHSTPPESFL